MPETETADHCIRIDIADMPAMRRTDEGYLMGEARVARIGIQSYQTGDGTVRRELRRPADVFDADSLSSFRMKPITLGHPAERLVSAENAARLTIGHVGENIRVDGEWLVMPLVVTDSRAIERIESGEMQQLSAGYRAEIEWVPGEYEGARYDGVQRNIRGNHVAIVQQARAGEMARINLDAADAVSVTDDMQTAERVDSMSDKTTTVVLDGIEYQTPPEVARALDKANERADSLAEEATAAKTAAETAKARADEATEKLAEAEKAHNDEAIQERVKARIDLERAASRVLGDAADMATQTDREVMESVVKHVHDAADLTEKSDVYVQARFDAALESFEHRGDAIAKQRQKAQQPRGDAGEGYKSDREHQKDALETMKDMYKRRDRKHGDRNVVSK